MADLSALDAILPLLDRDAAAVDGGAFPTAALDALGRAGLLGLTVPVANGGSGQGLAAAAALVERIAQHCGSTAMVVTMHYCGTAVLLAHADADTQRAAAEGRHLSTLAFSEAGSRSHFWAPLSTARADGDGFVLDAQKSWITSAQHATAYVWSSRPVGPDGFSTIWLVPRDAAGLELGGGYDGLGLRGNDSLPARATGVRLPASARLGEDGKGFDVMMGVVLPAFNVLNAAVSIGLAEGALQRAAAHAGRTRHEEAGTSLADLPTIRAHLARARIRLDMARALLDDTLAALANGRADAMLRVLEIKAAGSETALEVTAAALRVTGGAGYRKELPVERFFRDAQAGSIMGPTTDVLWDFVGKAVTGLPLF